MPGYHSCIPRNENVIYNILFSSPYTHISVRDLYISRIGLPILLFLFERKYADRSWEYINRTRECEIVTEATQFPEKEYINGISDLRVERKGHMSARPPWQRRRGTVGG